MITSRFSSLTGIRRALRLKFSDCRRAALRPESGSGKCNRKVCGLRVRVIAPEIRMRPCHNRCDDRSFFFIFFIRCGTIDLAVAVRRGASAGCGWAAAVIRGRIIPIGYSGAAPGGGGRIIPAEYSGAAPGGGGRIIPAGYSGTAPGGGGGIIISAGYGVAVTSICGGVFSVRWEITASVRSSYE